MTCQPRPTAWFCYVTGHALLAVNSVSQEFEEVFEEVHLREHGDRNLENVFSGPDK